MGVDPHRPHALGTFFRTPSRRRDHHPFVRIIAAVTHAAPPSVRTSGSQPQPDDINARSSSVDGGCTVSDFAGACETKADGTWQSTTKNITKQAASLSTVAPRHNRDRRLGDWPALYQETCPLAFEAKFGPAAGAEACIVRSWASNWLQAKQQRRTLRLLSQKPSKSGGCPARPSYFVLSRGRCNSRPRGPFWLLSRSRWHSGGAGCQWPAQIAHGPGSLGESSKVMSRRLFGHVYLV
jgi:hypothetical protein